jgi:hypothetical protein
MKIDPIELSQQLMCFEDIDDADYMDESMNENILIDTVYMSQQDAVETRPKKQRTEIPVVPLPFKSKHYDEDIYGTTPFEFIIAWNFHKRTFSDELKYSPKINTEKLVFDPQAVVEVIIDLFARAFEVGGVRKLDKYLDLEVFHDYYKKYRDTDTYRECVYEQLSLYVLIKKITTRNNYDFAVLVQKSVDKVKQSHDSAKLKMLMNTFMYYATELDYMIVLYSRGCSSHSFKYDGESKITQMIVIAMTMEDQTSITNNTKKLFDYLHNRHLKFGPNEFRVLLSFKPYTKYQQSIYDYLTDKKYILPTIKYHQTLFEFMVSN